MQHRREILIVFHDRLYGSPLDLERLTVPGVRFSEDRALLQKADAVVIHVPQHASPKGPFMPKPKGQLWVAWSLESDINYPNLKDPIWDLRMTYQRDADVWTPYFAHYGADFLERLRQPAPPKQPDYLIASFISSPFNRSGRLDYLKELSRHVDIHHYGRYLRNRFLQRDKGSATKLEILRRYKCVIAFENSIGVDYVTEKYYDALLVGAVPIYLGAPNVAEYSPGLTCYISVGAYGNPRELAEYLLALNRDETIRQSLIAWKQKPFRKDFVDMVRNILEAPHPFVRLAEAVKQRLATPKPSTQTAHRGGPGQRFSTGCSPTESRTLLLSYPGSGINWVRYIVEYLSGRKTWGCACNSSGAPLYLNRLACNALKHVDPALTPILYSSHGERIGEYRKWNRLVLITRNPAVVILNQTKRVMLSDIEYYASILRSYDQFEPLKRHLIMYEVLIADPRKVVSDLVEFLGIDKHRVEEFFENYQDHRKLSLSLYSAGRRAAKMPARWNSKGNGATNCTRASEFISCQLQVLLFLYRKKQAHLSKYFKLTL